MSVLGLHPVHHHPPQGVGLVDPGEGRPAAHGQDGLPHQLVAAHEADHVIREVPCGLVERVIRLTGTLGGGEGEVEGQGPIQNVYCR